MIKQGIGPLIAVLALSRWLAACGGSGHRRDGTTHLVMSPLEFMRRLPGLTKRAGTALANDSFAAPNLGSRIPGLGRDPV